MLCRSVYVLLLPLLVAFPGCDKSENNNCAGGACATGLVCGAAATGPTCVLPWQLDACVGLQPGEACFDDQQTPGYECDTALICLRVEECGNGVIETGEGCDDGNVVAGDGCNADCETEECGDGVVDAGEACDDGNLTNGDGCDALCGLEGCGNGVQDAGEECDDGAGNSDTTPNACREDCRLPHCGDSVIDVGEECDDGANNSDSPDACRTTCQLPTCGDSIVDSQEQCDPPGQAGCLPGSCFAVSGCYELAPPPDCNCAFGAVSFTLACVELSDDGSFLMIQPPIGSVSCGLFGTTAESGTIDTQCTVVGQCSENYSLTGTFSADGNWSGDFTASYTPAGLCADCQDPHPAPCTGPVTATRVQCPCL